jgi:steroid delta-isomerase-like uncharacterized protein
MAASEVDLARAAAELMDAFNELDWDRFEGHLAPDVVYAETGTGLRMNGAPAYVRHCQVWKEAFPDYHGTIRRFVVSGDTVAQDILWEGTHTGPLQAPGATLPPSGQRVSVDASMWTRFEAGKIKEIQHHVDALTLLQQIGALPAPMID